MSKYEIMLIVDPAIDVAMATDIVESVFGKTNVKKSEKLENTSLAYPINKSTKAHYMLYLVESEGSAIAEFTRKVNITKFIWRKLVINLDTERGLNRAKKTRKRFVNKDSTRKPKSATAKKFVEKVEKTGSKKSTTKKTTTKKTETSKDVKETKTEESK